MTEYLCDMLHSISWKTEKNAYTAYEVRCDTLTIYLVCKNAGDSITGNVTLPTVNVFDATVTSGLYLSLKYSTCKITSILDS